jgi:hypothetical protein
MTIALYVAVNDGVVLASDSAASMVEPNPTGGPLIVTKVYNNANKIFNLHKGSALGAVTYGVGSIGGAAISTLAKDFRAKLTAGEAIGPSGWKFDPATFTVEEVAVALRHFVFEETYVPAFAASAGKPEFGLNVAGYSAGSALPELWEIKVDDQGQCAAPGASMKDARPGWGAWAQPEAIQRLIVGFGSGLGDVLLTLGLSQTDLPTALTAIRSEMELDPVPPAMPIQDAIDLAEYLVHLTIKFVHFMPGAETVGGPVEIAAITKHEGFKWVRRKHYWDSALNPPVK